MYKNILKKEQLELLPLLKLFKKDFYLVGGTAIALQIGHRHSIDFDLFTIKPIRNTGIKNIIQKNKYTIHSILFEDSIQLHLVINNVKLTFYEFPYDIKPEIKFDDIIKTPDLLTLASMKAFALGRRGKWKDYVDLYFIFKHHLSFESVCKQASKIFSNAFNEKLFRQQLSYFEDIDFSEEVEYIDNNISKDTIKNFLTEISLKSF